MCDVRERAAPFLHCIHRCFDCDFWYHLVRHVESRCQAFVRVGCKLRILLDHLLRDECMALFNARRITCSCKCKVSGLKALILAFYMTSSHNSKNRRRIHNTDHQHSHMYFNFCRRGLLSPTPHISKSFSG